MKRAYFPMRLVAVAAIYSILRLVPLCANAAEFEVLDRFSVDGYTVLKSSADIPGGSFTVGGSAFVVNGGNVGIGTAVPGHLLDIGGINWPSGPSLFVKQSVSSDGFVVQTNGAADSAIRIYHDGTLGVVESTYRSITGYQPLAFFTNGAEKVRIDTGGNVGIGTTAPDTLLQLYKTDASTNTTLSMLKLIHMTNGTPATGLGAAISFGTQRTSGSIAITRAMIAGVSGSVELNQGDLVLLTRTDTGVDSATTGMNEKMRITSAGNVGIGTTNPGDQLHVLKTSDHQLAIDASGALSTIDFMNLGTHKAQIYWNNTADNFSIQSRAGTQPLLLNPAGGNVGIGTTNPVANLDIGGSGSIKIPLGTTAERPATPANGMVRLNTQTGKLEYYNNGWNSVGAAAATGGTVTDAGEYRIHTFTSNGTFTVNTGGNFEVLVVAGGGGGGRGWDGDGGGGGGGAGGYIYNAGLALAAGAYPVTVGDGGAGASSSYNGLATSGGSSSISSLVAAGGGAGRGQDGGTAASGGSGGGGCGGGSPPPGSGGSATSGQGYAGGSGASAPQYPGGGGGGAGGAGGNAIGSGTPGNGGLGVANSISGASLYYAGGGGGGLYTSNSGTPGTGGSGIGGAGGAASGGAGGAGTANRGGGGGGGTGKNGSYNGGAGGSGIVIIRYSN